MVYKEQRNIEAFDLTDLSHEAFCSFHISEIRHNLFILTSGAKYGLLAHTSLGLESVEDSFKTHSLTIVGSGKFLFNMRNDMYVEYFNVVS